MLSVTVSHHRSTEFESLSSSTTKPTAEFPPPRFDYCIGTIVKTDGMEREIITQDRFSDIENM